MKPIEKASGQALVGAGARVTDHLFWIALSDEEADVSANLFLLRTNNWIDLPLVYATGQRAILTFQKAAAGKQAFENALAAGMLDVPPVEHHSAASNPPRAAERNPIHPTVLPPPFEAPGSP